MIRAIKPLCIKDAPVDIPQLRITTTSFANDTTTVSDSYLSNSAGATIVSGQNLGSTCVTKSFSLSIETTRTNTAEMSMSLSAKAGYGFLVDAPRGRWYLCFGQPLSSTA